MTNIKTFDSNQIKIAKTTKKIIAIYYIRYITIENISYVKINSANSLYFIIDKVDGYIEESNGSKYLTLFSADKKKKHIKNVCSTIR